MATTLLILLLVTAFAAWLLLHLVLSVHVATELRPKALVVLLLLPPTFVLAGYWGFKFGHKRLVSVWGLCMLSYVVSWCVLA